MKRVLILLALMILTTGMLFAERTAVVKSFTGKVEYRSGSGSWAPVSAGMKLPLGATISTGFDSRAVLEIAATTINVAPLTRMRIDQLSEKEGVATTGVTLQVGKVKADVKPVEGLQTDFVIKSPVTTASVRGTVFEFDPENLDVEEGVVIYTDEYNQYLAVSAGESASGSGAFMSGGNGGQGDDFDVSINTGDNGSQMNGQSGGSTGGTSGGSGFGSVTVQWTYEGF
jgi:hypothetical protein